MQIRSCQGQRYNNDYEYDLLSRYGMRHQFCNMVLQGLVEIDDVDTTAEVEEEADVKPSEQELCDNRLAACDLYTE